MNRRQFLAYLFGTAAVQLVIGVTDLAPLRSRKEWQTTTAMAICDTCGMQWPHNRMRLSGRLLTCDRGYCRALVDSFTQTKGYAETINDVRMDLTSLKWAEFDRGVDVKVG